MLKLKNNEAFQALNTTYLIRDNELIELKFYYLDYIPNIQLTLQKKLNTVVTMQVTLSDVEEFDYYYSKDGPTFIEDYKLLETTEGFYYLSLDPYDSTTEISDKDCGIIVAKTLVVEII